MEVDSPIWTMKRLCPECGQGSCLVFVACPACGHLAIRCDEEGAVFLDPRNLSLTADATSQTCPGCALHLVAGFPPASDASIRAHGFAVAEYE
jgi:hypothetical protein